MRVCRSGASSQRHFGPRSPTVRNRSFRKPRRRKLSPASTARMGLCPLTAALPDQGAERSPPEKIGVDSKASRCLSCATEPVPGDHPPRLSPLLASRRETSDERPAIHDRNVVSI